MNEFKNIDLDENCNGLITFESFVNWIHQHNWLCQQLNVFVARGNGIYNMDNSNNAPFTITLPSSSSVTGNDKSKDGTSLWFLYSIDCNF